MVQWLRLHASTAVGVGSIPGWGTKIPHALGCGQKLKTKNPTILLLSHVEFFLYAFWRLKRTSWASLVEQLLRIRLPMQGTWVRSLVREDPTCRGAMKPVHHNY